METRESDRKADTPQSYLVETPEGAVYRRNRRHLHRDASHDQSILHTYSGTNVQSKQREITEHKQQSRSPEHQQASNDGAEGYRTRSGRLVKQPNRY